MSKYLVENSEIENLKKLIKSHKTASQRSIDGTICEFSGMEDKNGIRIYEGYIVRINPGGGTPSIGVCVFEKCAYGVRTYGCTLWTKASSFMSFEYRKPKDLEVIGNIFENPEKLEYKTWD